MLRRLQRQQCQHVLHSAIFNFEELGAQFYHLGYFFV
jgi:hypothetical protein